MNKIKKSIIQLIIGIILLLIVWIASSFTPDKQRTFFNQINVLYQQGIILLYSIIGKGEEIKNLINFNMAFNALYEVGIGSNCLSGEILEKFKSDIEDLKNISLDNFILNFNEYRLKYIKYKEHIKNNCPGVNLSQ